VGVLIGGISGGAAATYLVSRYGPQATASPSGGSVLPLPSAAPVGSTALDQETVGVVQDLLPAVVTVINYGPNRQPQSSGSGFVVDAQQGYIVTNNHVVDGATELTVSMLDKREMRARVIGKDAKTDIALLKVDARNLPYARLGNSADVEVGDIALAIGNPFGLGQTVTMGIISATGRGGLGIEDYEDFIQTDASINPGNSGGALVDTKGEVIGINTAILSGSGGNQGVGFAVPVDMVRQVTTQLKEKGAVTRARLGVYFRELTPELASELRVKASKGAVIDQIVPDGPASKTGLREDDVIVALNGKETDGRSLRLAVGSMAPGTTINLKVLRAGSERNFSITLDAMTGDSPRAEQGEPFPYPRRRRG
jgi:Do/DeqQ family serine protease